MSAFIKLMLAKMQDLWASKILGLTVRKYHQEIRIPKHHYLEIIIQRQING